MLLVFFSLVFGLLIIPFFGIRLERIDLILLACGNGLFVLINLMTVFEAAKRGPMAILWPVAWLSAPVTGLLWFVLDGFDNFSRWHGTGLGVFLLSLFFMWLGKRADDGNPDGAKIKPFFFILVITAMLSGVGANVFMKYAFLDKMVQQFDFRVTYSLTASLIVASGMFIYWKLKAGQLEFRSGKTHWAVLGGMLMVTQFVIITVGITKADPAIFFCSFAGVAIAGAVVSARLFQKEKVAVPVLFGVFFAIVAIISFSLA